MNPVVHFEMPMSDKERMSNFYKNAFGWDMQVMGEDYGGYIVATTTESDNKGPKRPGAINGGFFMRDDVKGDMYPSVVISVDNIDESITEVKKAGGEILDKKMGIPGIGTYASFRDTEGNRVGMLQASER